MTIDFNIWWVFAGLCLMGIASAWTGLFLSLKGDVLSGDVLAHGVLPGIAIAFIFSGSKEIYYLAPAAFVSGWLTLESRDWLVRIGIRPDTAAAMSLSFFYGLGIVLLSYIRHSGSGAQSGLDRFLFGSAAAILPEEILFSSLLAALILILILLNYRSLFLCFFDKEWAISVGYKPQRIERLITLMTLACVVTGVQMAGVVLMSSFLIAPALAASAWVRSFKRRIPMVALISVVSILIGAGISFRLPQMPTGPWVVVMLSLFAFIGILSSRLNRKV